MFKAIGKDRKQAIRTLVSSFLLNDRKEKRNKKAQKSYLGTSLAVQWLRLHASNVEGSGSMPGQETKIPHAV